LNGTIVNTDDLLVEPDKVPPPEQKMASVIPDDHILTREEKFDLEVVLGKHSDVFLAKPAGSARVEPMAIHCDNWVPPSMEPPRVHAPRIKAAVDMELHLQIELGVVEVSYGDNGVQQRIWIRSPFMRRARPTVIVLSDSQYEFCLHLQ
jgi:hypothetical protein